MKVFSIEHRKADEVELQNLLEVGTVWKIILEGSNSEVESCKLKNSSVIEDGGHILYNKGCQSEFFTFILDGKAEIFSGRQMFRTEVSRFTILFPDIFTKAQEDYIQGFELSDIVPDFTARIIQNSRILRISRTNFIKCLQGKLKNYHRRPKTMEFNFDHQPAIYSPQNIESCPDLKTVAPGARNLKIIDCGSDVIDDNNQTKYNCREQMRWNSNSSIENVPQSSSCTRVHEKEDMIYPREEITLELRSPSLHRQREGLRSSESDEGVIDEIRSPLPV